LLISVRNLIVHAKPQDAKVRRDADGKLVWVEPNIMCRLQGSRVLGMSESLRNAASTLGADTIVSDMLAEISTHSVAQWACKAAAGVVNGLLDAILQAQFRAFMEIAYRKDFGMLPREEVGPLAQRCEVPGAPGSRPSFGSESEFSCTPERDGLELSDASFASHSSVKNAPGWSLLVLCCADKVPRSFAGSPWLCQGLRCLSMTACGG